MSIADRAARALRLPPVTGRVDQQPLTEQVETDCKTRDIERHFDRDAVEAERQKGSES